MNRTIAGELPPIPISRWPRGPILSRQRRKRLTAAGTLWLIGVALQVFGPSPLATFGIGLMFPGAGFLYNGRVWLFLIVVALTAAAAARMWIVADHLSLPLTYAGSAILATLTRGSTSWALAEWTATLAFPMIILIAQALQWASHLRSRRLGRRRNAYLRTQQRRIQPVERALIDRQVIESTPNELQLQRWVLDHALQPLDDWDVYDWREKGQRDPRSVRYQLNWLQWALALSQSSRTPAFSGYMAEAQRRLIERMLDRRIWGYWRSENLLGNLDNNPDPVRKDNIMFSGYLGLMVGTYAALNMDRRYDQPGALTFEWDADKRFIYDHATLSDAIQRNFATSRLGMFACEPTFVFPICNTIALLGLAYRDVLDDGDRLDRLLPMFARSLNEEFTAPDGDFHVALCDRYGFRAIPSRGMDVTGQHGFYLRPLLPDISERIWAICRRELVDSQAFDPDRARGRPLYLGDWGDKKSSLTILYMSLAAQSREFGDDDIHHDVIEAAREALGWRVEGGVGCYERVSCVGNAQLALAQLGRTDGWLDMLQHRSRSSAIGPRLADVAYPDVLVAKAAAGTDSLELVIYPGEEPGRQHLHLDNLRAGEKYRVEGAVTRQVTADGAGTAVLVVDLEARLQLHIERV